MTLEDLWLLENDLTAGYSTAAALHAATKAALSLIDESQFALFSNSEIASLREHDREFSRLTTLYSRALDVVAVKITEAGG
jgi:hypothetical protein